jgi:hypothetical protein
LTPKRLKRVQRQQAMDAAYREALGVSGELPKKLGTIASAGAARDRRGKVTTSNESRARRARGASSEPNEPPPGPRRFTPHR